MTLANLLLAEQLTAICALSKYAPLGSLLLISFTILRTIWSSNTILGLAYTQVQKIINKLEGECYISLDKNPDKLKKKLSGFSSRSTNTFLKLIKLKNKALNDILEI